jgi:hypothetical protein
MRPRRLPQAWPRYHQPIVYYVSVDGDAVKIGTSSGLRNRLSGLDRHLQGRAQILAVELGDVIVESARHAQFHEYRIKNELFHLTGGLLAHVLSLPDLIPKYQPPVIYVDPAAEMSGVVQF